MAHPCGALSAFALAGAIVHAGITVSWNTRTSRVASPPKLVIQTARLLGVQGTHVIVRMQNGAVQNYTTTPEQARLLRGFVGAQIEFRVNANP